MPTVYRVTARAGGSIGEADTMVEVVELAKDVPPGRYRVEKMSLDPVTWDLRSWKWGTIFKDRKGVIKLGVSQWFD